MHETARRSTTRAAAYIDQFSDDVLCELADYVPGEGPWDGISADDILALLNAAQKQPKVKPLPAGLGVRFSTQLKRAG